MNIKSLKVKIAYLLCGLFVVQLMVFLICIFLSSYFGLLQNSYFITISISFFISIFFAFGFVYNKVIKFNHKIEYMISEFESATLQNKNEVIKSGVLEFDKLYDIAVDVSKRGAEYSEKFSKIATLVSVPIGVYEQNISSNEVFLNNTLLEILEIKNNGTDGSFLSIEEWEKKYSELTAEKEKGYSNVYKIISENYGFKWVRIEYTIDDTRVMGIVAEVTEEIFQRKKMQYERDHDLLTKLLNRRAFYEAVAEALSNNQDKINVIMMCDLDNLKYINDTFGHEYGDLYISTFADLLATLDPSLSIISRMSGDEFLIFMYGFTDKKEAMVIIENLFIKMSQTTIKIKDNPPITLKSTAGISWFPENSMDVKKMIKYADFAMYDAKKTKKGTVKEFCLESYNENEASLAKEECLKQIIQNHKFHLLYQPIINVKTADVIGYEALMRSNLLGLEQPQEIIKLAISQGKIQQLEIATISKVFKYLKENVTALNAQKIFFNSISEYFLMDEERVNLISEYGDYFKEIIIDVTDNIGGRNFKQKIANILDCGSEICFDNFGTSYGNEKMLLDNIPNFIKVDREIICNIDQDNNRHEIVENILRYTSTRGIKLVAQGIETKEELQTVIALGFDYVQGFYLANPLDVCSDISAEKKTEIISAFKEFNKN